MMKTTIILADDHKILREGLRALLDSRKDFEVSGEANSGTEAVRLSKELEADVVVMDITMPDLNGIDATRKLAHEVPNVKVVALSVHFDMHYVARMFAAGAKGYLRKDCAS